MTEKSTFHTYYEKEKKPREKILVVSSEYSQREILRGILSKGYEVLECGDGATALRIARQNKAIALVLADINTPEADEEEQTAMLLGLQAMCLPFAAIADADDDASQLRALELGAQDIIARPFNRALVLHRVRNALRLGGLSTIPAASDAMTGLLNRAAMERMVGERLRNARDDESFALFMLDVDNFKSINDTMGHQQGDDTLIRVGEALRRCFRSTDPVCRFGGDEYMAFLTGGITPELVTGKAEELREALQFAVGEIVTTVSVGVVLAQGQGLSFKELYHAADQAMYCAKRGGKNSFCICSAETLTPSEEQTQAPAAAVQLQTLLQYMSGGIAVACAEGGRVGLSYISPSIENYLASIGEHIDTAGELFTLIFPPDLPEAIGALQASAETGEQFDTTVRFGKDGSRWLRLRGTRLPECGNGKTLLLGVLQDVTGLRCAVS